MPPKFTVIYGLFLYLGFCACSKESNTSTESSILGHDHLISGVYHATPPEKAPRYCTFCHGLQLEGSATAPRSCYSCHGQMWYDYDGSTSSAPSDHTVDHEGFLHAADLNSPLNNCNLCHGETLEGVKEGSTTPGCNNCHGNLWE